MTYWPFALSKSKIDNLPNFLGITETNFHCLLRKLASFQSTFKVIKKKIYLFHCKSLNKLLKRMSSGSRGGNLNKDDEDFVGENILILKAKKEKYKEDRNVISARGKQREREKGKQNHPLLKEP